MALAFVRARSDVEPACWDHYFSSNYARSPHPEHACAGEQDHNKHRHSNQHYHNGCCGRRGAEAAVAEAAAAEVAATEAAAAEKAEAVSKVAADAVAAKAATDAVAAAPLRHPIRASITPTAMPPVAGAAPIYLGDPGLQSKN